MDNILVDIAICTFRRPHVTDTLRSIAQLALPSNVSIRVIVADNDDTPSARELVERTAKDLALSLTYVHAPARNISIARNACLNTATAPLLAFIDDDECVIPQWLNAMLAAMETTNADVVLGPVHAEYPEGCPEWVKRGNFHSTQPIWVNNTIITGYAGNVLLKHFSQPLKGLRFRLDLGRSGGEDTVYFSSVFASGGRIAFAEDAIATEKVSPERITFSWLWKRKFRGGQTHALMLMEHSRAALSVRASNIAKASAKALYCFAGSLANAPRAEKRYFWLLRGAVHMGVISRLIGKKNLELYGSGH